MFKRMVSWLLILSMVLSMNVTVFAADTVKINEDIITVELSEFNKTGTVITLINDFNTNYYLLTEEVGKNNTVGMMVKKEITKEQFETYYNGKSYNKLSINVIANNNNTPLYTNVVFDSNDHLINSSVSGNVIDGNFTPISADTTKDTYNWIYSKDGNHYLVTSNTKEKTAVYKPITELEYEKLLFNEDFVYEQNVSEKISGGTTVRTEVIYDSEGDVLGVPTIIEINGSGNIAEIAYVLNSVSGGTILGLPTINRTIEKYGNVKTSQESTQQPTAQEPNTQTPAPTNPPVQEVKENVEKIYRVRKSWDNAGSQIGAYKDLDTAIEVAKENKLNVYDWDGRLMWEGVPKQETPKQEPPKQETPKVEEPKPTQPSKPTQPTQPPKEDKPTNTPNKPANNNTGIEGGNELPEEKENAFEMNADLMLKYDGLYSTWMDEYNSGYLGFWLDPYFAGSMLVVEWQDPFWSEQDINQTLDSSAVSGYYDSLGNYIAVDKSGNPIPKEPGTFDSAGNFKPENSTGYYDPDGVYHPLFEEIEGLSYEFDGSFHIDNYGYFDADGIWHAKNHDKNTIVLFDGRIVHRNGYIENPQTKAKIKIEKDIWGNYFYNDEVIYSDYSVYNKKENTLTIADGTVYKGKGDNVYILFENNDAIIKDTFEKGKKTITGVLLNNGGTITDTGVIHYPNGITYSVETGISLPNGEIRNETFADKEYIDLAEYGRIYPNGHIAVYNNYGDLVTDMDAVIFEDRILLDTGDIYKDGEIFQTYRDANGNLVCTDGYIISTNLQLGAYAKTGEFVVGKTPEAGGYYDRLGNLMTFDGEVLNMNTQEVGYYNRNGEFVVGTITTVDYYYTADRTKICADNTVIKLENLYGYYDKANNFVMNDGGGFFDSQGTYSQVSNNIHYNITNSGLFYKDLTSKFIINIDGSISVMGEKGTYDENGMVKLNGDYGYYDEKGMFIISKTNPYIESGYFFDSLQNKHNYGAIYRDSEGALRLLQNPQFGLTIVEDKIKISTSEYAFDVTGLTSKNGKTGYFTVNGDFVESNVSPYIGGFYNEAGFWVDRTYYIDIFGDLVVNYGGFNYMGNYITPTGDIGSFNKNGVFQVNMSNLLQENFYDNKGVLSEFDGFYRDEFGIYKSFDGDEVYNLMGTKLEVNDSVGMKIEEYVMIEYGMFISPDGQIGHFDADGKFNPGRSKYVKGFYTPSGGFVYYGTSEKMTKATNFFYIGNKYYVVLNKDSKTDGVLTMYDGYSFNVKLVGGKYFQFEDGMVISETGKYGHLEGNQFVEGASEIPKKIISTTYSNYIDLTDEFGYFTKDGTFVLYDGGYGYYNEEGTLIGDALNPYSNGFYTYEGVWKKIGSFSDVPNVGYFNKYGIKRNGENPYNTGYYDYEGSFHPFEKDYFITNSGNVMEAGENGIGYIDNNGNLHLYSETGYFDKDGNYYIGNNLQGYYDENGVLSKGKNPNFDGYYDMMGNWHMFGDKGYYSPAGYYYEDVTDFKVGYFNEVGEFTEGYNPYINGYNDINGNWSDSFTMPLTIYYLKDGTARVGMNPYKEGYYDMYANWHRFGDKGYFDKHGTYYSINNGSYGYYDSKGNYMEGTNPYQHGYYDEDGNLRLFEHEGYFTRTGTFVDEKGRWYFLEGSLKKKGENTNEDGFYDKYGNFYPFDEDGYYTPEKLFFPTLLVVDKYRVGSANYILFEGIFTNPDFVPSSSKNTIQFTFNASSGAPLFVDTGIKVSKNAMISYANARDLLHNIAVYSKSSFIEDNDSCMVIVDGQIINLTNNGKMSINELRNKFIDSGISITIAQTRIGGRFALADSIEKGNNIKILMDGKKYNINNPLVVKNNVAYISLKDITDVIAYNTKVETDENGKLVTFTIKDNASAFAKAVSPVGMTMRVGNSECLVNIEENVYSYHILKAPIISTTVGDSKIEEIYVPIYLLNNLSGYSVQYNTMDYLIEMYPIIEEGNPYINVLPFADN